MKRVLAFASALALAVGAFAPAAFADDYVPAQIPITEIYANPELYDLYVAPYYNNLSFSDWGDYATDAVISGFPMNTVKQIEATEGGLESLWNTVHDAFTFGYNIGQDWVSKLYVDTSDGRLKSDGNIMTDDLKALLDQYFKTTPPASEIVINGHTWVKFPIIANNNQGYVACDTSWPASVDDNIYDVWITRTGSSGNVATAASWIYSGNQPKLRCYTNVNLGGFVLGNRYYYNGVNYYCNDGNLTIYPLGMSQQYSNPYVALADFYGNFDSATGGGVPYWNGDGYYRDEYNVDIALPALPAIDWQDLNNNYYTEYGGDFVDGDVNNFYYDISYNYFPAEYTYTIPYWLIDGNTTVLDFNYSLELPSVDLYELPSEFGGGEEVWDSSFTMLGGFGAFILLGFSFGLVALFFKD